MGRSTKRRYSKTVDQATVWTIPTSGPTAKPLGLLIIILQAGVPREF